MQCSIVSYSTLQEHPEFRIDAECYIPYHLKIEQSIREKGFKLIQDYSISVINFGAYSLCNYIEFLDSGKPFLVTEDIKNNVIETGKLHYIAEEVHLLLHKSHCVKGQVLLTMAGAYLGQAAVFDEDFECSSNQAIAKITLKSDSISPYWLSTFLNCKHGQSQIERFKTGTGQPNLNLGLIKLIKVVRGSIHFQAIIGRLVKTALADRKESLVRYEAAQALLLSELGLTDWQPKHSLSFVKNYSDTEQAGRLDAEHFQPKYDELIEAITTNSFYSKSISEIQTYNARGLQPKYAVDGELDVITSEHILEHDLNYDGFEKTCESNWKKQKKARVKEGDILTYTTGANIGRTACYSISKPALASNHVNILRIKNENPEYVAFVMNSLVGRLQTERLSAGSAQAELYPKDIEKYLIPFAEEKIQQEIVASIEESRAFKAQSKHLLECAKRAVELAIEQDEQTALDWLEKETQGLQ